MWPRLNLVRLQCLKGMWWSLCFNLFVLSVLAMIYIVIPQKERPITITLTSVAIDDSDLNLPPIEFGDIDVLEQELVEPELAEPEPLLEEPSLELSEVTIPEIPAVSNNTAPNEVTVADEGPQANTLRDTMAEGPGATTDHRIANVHRRVKQAGGNVEGPIVVSLSFTGDDDIDLHVQFQGRDRRRPVFGHIFYAFRRNAYATLDVDANAETIMPNACENIVFHDVPTQANYAVVLNHFRRRGPPEPTLYLVVVKVGTDTRVYEGVIMPFQTKTICTFTHRK